ncbi:MAG: hypothetical protein P8P74_07825 [Crocinitomicaceae bacterium]|nr:hypothetical protein [Crocinitomicaceae bacterium]
MKSTFVILIIALLLASCGSKQGNYYFDCDQIDHYSIEIDEDVLFGRMIDSAALSENELLQQAVIIGETPTSINDTFILEDFGAIGFEKNTIHGGKLQEIKEIFKEKNHKERLVTSCVAIYRDVFVFRKNGKIVGLAKVCFGCMMRQINGTDADTFHFAQSGDYAKLESILTGE